MTPTHEEIKEALLKTHGLEDKGYSLREAMIMCGVGRILEHKGAEVNIDLNDSDL